MTPIALILFKRHELHQCNGLDENLKSGCVVHTVYTYNSIIHVYTYNSIIELLSELKKPGEVEFDFKLNQGQGVVKQYNLVSLEPKKKRKLLFWSSMFQRRQKYFSLREPCSAAQVHSQTKERSKKKSCSGAARKVCKNNFAGFCANSLRHKVHHKARCTCIPTTR